MNPAEAKGAAAAASENTAMNDALAAQIGRLNGEIAAMNGDAAMVKGPQGQQLGQNGATGMSGAEFLGVMQGARGGNAKQGQSGLMGDPRGGGAGQQGLTGEAKPNLKLIRGEKNAAFGNSLDRSLIGRNEEAMVGSAAAAAQLGLQNQNAGVIPPAQLTGHVVKGRMATDRLSSESLLGVSTSIKEMGMQGGGEMKIRLKPEHLGELHVSVRTDGHHVGLQIQASDERAKAIIEESMSHLKESLASHSMTLGRVDVSVAGAQNASNAGGGQDFYQQQQQSQSQNLAGQSFDGMMRQGSNGQGRGDGDSARADSAPRTTASVPRSGLSSMSNLMAAGSRAGRPGGIDVMA
jgi:flagellar hook-length control protein FliK